MFDVCWQMGDGWAAVANYLHQKGRKKEQALSDVIAVICVISHFLGFVSLMSPGETCRASPSCRVEMVAADPATAVAT